MQIRWDINGKSGIVSPTQRLSIQTPSDRRFRCWQVKCPSKIRRQHLHRKFHFNNRSRLRNTHSENQDSRHRSQDLQTSDLGHGRSRKVPNNYIFLLPRRPWNHRRLRLDQQGLFHERRELDE
jgi:hypothetical protein